MKAHGAEIIDEEIYVSDGSESEAEKEIEMVLVGSRMGIMRKGIHHQMLVQPNRQWTRKSKEEEQKENNEKDDEEAEQKRLKEQEDELANLDPAQRAARLLVEKQRKLEEAKINARRLESEENAGRDPCLFSKRTAFDIRFDQIDDKPWTRGDPTDYFNYGLMEEDWLEYSQQQLMIRQELTDASRQRRAPDPTLVPVTPRLPSKQQPKVAVAPTGTNKNDDDEDGDDGDNSGAVVGPVLVKKEDEPKASVDASSAVPSKPAETQDVPVGAGGAWGAGAAPGSILAKLIEEQEKKIGGGGNDNDSYMGESQDGYGSPNKSSRYGNNDLDSDQQQHGKNENRWQQQHPGNDSNSNSYYGSNANSNNDWNNQDPRSNRGGGGSHYRQQQSHYQQQQQQQQSHYQQQQSPPQHQQRFDPRDPRGGRGRGGGRGYMGRGGRGGGRGYYNDGGGGGRGHYGGDSYNRKRSREYDDHHGGSRGGWRR